MVVICKLYAMKPMADIEQYKIELNNTAQSLIGNRIEQVFYWEIDYGSVGFDKDDYHSLDFGISFITNNKTSYYIIWDSKCVQFDIKIVQGEIMDEFKDDSNIISYDVTNTIKWLSIINKEIIDINVKWYSDINAPQDILISFENTEQVIISSSEVWEDKKAKGMSDNIVIFFNTQVANKYGISV